MYSSAVLIEVVFTPHLRKMQKYSRATPILEALYLGIRLSRIKRHIHKALKPFPKLVNEAPNHGGRETADLSNVHVPLGLSIWLPTLPRQAAGAHQDYWLQCQQLQHNQKPNQEGKPSIIHVARDLETSRHSRFEDGA